MSSKFKLVLYVIAASGLIWYALDSFLGVSDGYASRLDLRSTAHLDEWTPGSEVADPHASAGGANSESERRGGSDRGGRGGSERLTVDAERADSDGDIVRATVSVAGMSPEEAALLERMDPELLKGPPPTRALDLTATGCTLAPAGAVDGADATDATDGVDGVAAGEGGAEPAGPLTREDHRVGVLFRHGSVAIKGRSLGDLDAVVDAFRDCATGLLVIEHNPQGRADVDGDRRLMTRRAEELKYYLLQRRVEPARMRVMEPS